MPIIIPKDIPAFSTLQKENIFVMTQARAIGQDIRPIEIAVLNLMPTKIETETQLIRLLSNSPLQVNITLINTSTYQSKNVSATHLKRFYKSFADIKNLSFDGMIITGAPVETLEFSDVKYFKELEEIMDFARRKVTSAMYICWGAQAALYHFYGIGKHNLSEKKFGVFPHKKMAEFDPLLKGLDDWFNIPHSRHTYIKDGDIFSNDKLAVLAYSEKAGASVIKSKDNKMIFITGHCEYDRDTLKKEYERDLGKGLPIKPPENYFTDKKCEEVNFSWCSTGNIIFSNWLNYYVYQVTPFDINKITNYE